MQHYLSWCDQARHPDWQACVQGLWELRSQQSLSLCLPERLACRCSNFQGTWMAAAEKFVDVL